MDKIEMGRASSTVDGLAAMFVCLSFELLYCYRLLGCRIVRDITWECVSVGYTAAIAAVLQCCSLRSIAPFQPNTCQCLL